jgi:hypothetical protein
VILKGGKDEKFFDQQEPILLLLAQEENREGHCLQGGQYDRKDYPHFWAGTDTRPKSPSSQKGQAMGAHIPYQEEYSDMEAYVLHACDKIRTKRKII